MSSAVLVRPYTIKEEVWNSAVHGVGIVLGVVSIPLLVIS